MRVGSRFNAREARRCCSNTSEKGVKTAGLKTLLCDLRRGVGHRPRPPARGRPCPFMTRAEFHRPAMAMQVAELAYRTVLYFSLFWTDRSIATP